MKTSEHQTRAFLCAGTLDGLLAELLPAANLRRETLEKVKLDLAKLLRDYPEYFR